MGVLKSKAQRDLVDHTGRLFQRVGLPRSVGQIYGLLYLSNRPLSLDDLVAMLGLSKGSASGGTRHLVTLGAIRQVWVPGERRDFYESVGDVSTVVRSIYREFLKPRVGATGKALGSILIDLERDRKLGDLTAEEADFCRARLEGLVKFQKRLDRLAPLAEKLLL